MELPGKPTHRPEGGPPTGAVAQTKNPPAPPGLHRHRPCGKRQPDANRVRAARQSPRRRRTAGVQLLERALHIHPGEAVQQALATSQSRQLEALDIHLERCRFGEIRRWHFTRRITRMLAVPACKNDLIARPEDRPPEDTYTSATLTPKASAAAARPRSSVRTRAPRRLATARCRASPARRPVAC